MNITKDEAREWARAVGDALQVVHASDSDSVMSVDEYHELEDKLGRLHTALLQYATGPIEEQPDGMTARTVDEYFRQDQEGMEECLVCKTLTHHTREGNGITCQRCGFLRAVGTKDGDMEKWRLKDG